MRMTDLRRGWAVVASDGRRVGTVKDVGQNYVLTSRRGLPGDLHIPASAIVNVVDEVVHLSLAHRDVQKMGWEQPPRGDDTLETGPEEDLHRHF
jgi:hypothetical protein